MEPYNIDEQIQNELQNRKIQPSAAAWDRLDAMLTVAEKPKKSFLLWQVAASFIGFLLLGTVLFFQSKPLVDQSNQDTFVTNDIIEPNEKTKGATIEQSKTINTNKIVIVNQSKQVAPIEKQVVNNNNVKINIGNPVKSSSKNLKEILQSKVEEVAANSTPDPKIEKTLDQIQQPKYISPASLLADIEKKSNDLKIEVTLQNQPYKVNAKSLLTQVDDELETSFRQRVIQKLNKTYQTTKVAVASRNNAK